MNIFKKIIFCFILLITSISISGCWDRKELQERHIVTGVAVDVANKGLKEGQTPEGVKNETFTQPHGNKIYRLSLQILDIKPSGGDSQSMKTSTYVISNTGESIYEMIRDMQGQVGRVLWFEHIQTIILSEEAIKLRGLKPILDFFQRDSELRWRMRMLITTGEARRILEYQPPSGEIGAMHIANSVRQHLKTGHIVGEFTDIGHITAFLDNNVRVGIPRVELIDNIIKVGGLALIKNGKFLGYVDDYAVQGGKILVGTEKSMIITAECPKHPGKLVAFEVFNHDTSLKPHVGDEGIYFTIDIEMRGNLGEVQCAKEHNFDNPKELAEMETLFAEEVKHNMLYALKTFQDMRVDGALFGPKLKAYKPEVWEEVKDRWEDEVFPTVTLIPSVNVKIRGAGER